ncbi:hypothetical protein SAMN04488063_1753 [Halopelagius inordinatus]|uniref:Uncharacterized protein n=1 Tax=Halopelagius inordinatus TaxID=553467 RepID=A0A1I2R235_9EURY|nr:hypothetical protein [Halopelagius inordinatus]SFG34568.1 hypothetical protein SAMN04488063_1753 [Halopelagius inordinatus]
MTTTRQRVAEVPGAIGDWAAGVAAVVEENLPRAAVFVLAFLGVGLAPFGAGLLAVLLAVVLPALGVGVFSLAKSKVPPLVRERFGSSRPEPFGDRPDTAVERRPSGR